MGKEMLGGMTQSLPSEAPSSSLALIKISSSGGGPPPPLLCLRAEGFLDVVVFAGGSIFLSLAADSRSAFARLDTEVNLVMGVPRRSRGMIRRPSRAHSAQLLTPPILYDVITIS